MDMVFSFPENVTSIKIKLNGQDYMWPNGLEGLISSSDKYLTKDSFELYKYLIRNGMFSSDLYDYFPVSSSGDPIMQVIPLELLTTNLPNNAPSALEIELLFNSNKSPDLRSIFVIQVVEQILEDRAGDWHFTYNTGE